MIKYHEPICSRLTKEQQNAFQHNVTFKILLKISQCSRWQAWSKQQEQIEPEASVYLCILFLLRCDVRLLSSSTTLYVKLATVVVLCDCERVSTFTFYAAPLSVYNSTGTTCGGGDCCLWPLLYLSSWFNCETWGHKFSFKPLKRQIRFLFFSSPCSINFIYTMLQA